MSKALRRTTQNLTWTDVSFPLQIRRKTC